MTISEKVLMTIELTKSEKATLEALAEAEKQTPSNMLENLIRSFLSQGVPTPEAETPSLKSA